MAINTLPIIYFLLTSLSISFYINAQPIGESFTNPKIINSLPYSDAANTASYVNDFVAANNQPAPDVFYKLRIPDCIDSIVISLCNSNFDTYLHILNASGVAVLNNDNSTHCLNNNRSFITTKGLFTPGTDIYIVVEGAGISFGNYVLEVTGFQTAPSPPISITPIGSTTVCQGGSVQLEATNNVYYTYQWKRDGVNIPGATGRILYATETGNYSVSILYNGCRNTSLPVSVNVISLPNISISPATPQLICTGGNVTFTASSGINYTYQWRKNNINIPGATGQSYVATSDGSYSVRVIANGCPTFSPAVNVFTTTDIAPPATITALSNTTFCAGESVTLAAPAGYTYQWIKDSGLIPGANAMTYVATQAGEYSVRVSNATCSNLSNQITVDVKPNPIADISPGGNIPLCKPTDGVLLQASQAPGNTYRWFQNATLLPGETNHTLLVTSPGTYSVSVTNNGCVTNSTPVNVISGAGVPATINASGPVSICQPGTVNLNAPVGSNFNYKWLLNGTVIPGANSSNYLADKTGNYQLILTANNCIDTSAVFFVEIKPLPKAEITLGGPAVLCPGGSVELRAPLGNNYIYQWRRNGEPISGSNNPTFVATAGGSYEVTISANGCTATSSAVPVTEGTYPIAEIIAPNPPIICPNTPLTLSAKNGNPDFAYRWYLDNELIAGASGPNHIITKGGKYAVEVILGGCQALSSPVIITEVSAPTVVAGPDKSICLGDSIILSVTGNAMSYHWIPATELTSPQSPSTLARPTTTTTYIVTGKGANGCETKDTIVVTVKNVPRITLTASGPTRFCVGQSVELIAPDSMLAYQWSNGNTGRIITVTEAGNYRCYVTTPNGCLVGSDVITIITNSPPERPQIRAEGPTSFCIGDSVKLSGPPGFIGYVWSNGENTSSIYAKKAGIYTLTVDNGCATATSLPIIIDAKPAPTQPVITMADGELLSDYPISNQWYKDSLPIPGATQPRYRPTTSGNYQVAVSASNGCISFSQPFNFIINSRATTTEKTVFKLYPNPASNTVTVMIISAENIPIPISKIELFDLSGKMMLQQQWNEHNTETILNVANLPAGIYKSVLMGKKGEVLSYNWLYLIE